MRFMTPDAVQSRQTGMSVLLSALEQIVAWQ